MSPKAYILKLLVIITGFSVLLSESLSSTTMRTPVSSTTMSTEDVDDLELFPEAIDCKPVLIKKIEQRKVDPLEKKKINHLLNPYWLKKREISLKDLISLFIDIFYTNLSYRTKRSLNLNEAVVDENIRVDYRRLTELIEEEVLDYIVPVNFIEILSRSENLFHIVMSKIYDINYIPKMKEMNRMRINEEFQSIMTNPKHYSRNLGYPMDNLISFIEKMILNPVIDDKENDRLRISYQQLIDKFDLIVKKDENGTFRNEPFSSLMKIILSEVPQDLRKEVFSGNWRRGMDVKVLDLIKNLSNMYHVNLLSWHNFKCDDQFVKEFSRCTRCQRIALEAILMALERFLRQYFEGYDRNDEL